MEQEIIIWTAVGIGIAFLIALKSAFVAILFRKVVPTNEVHIVQSSKTTTSYGKDTGNGNTYYAWPTWIPRIGTSRVVLPVSVFDLALNDYEAYDKDRLPFLVDVIAFFRITDSNTAAQRVSNFEELHKQLRSIVQGAIRSVLAGSDLDTIMLGRSKFGDDFTKEVSEQLGNWGVSTVKNIELMDLRDTPESQVIHQIMSKKKSHVEMESRTEVAKNKRTAETAEIDAQKEIDMSKQQAKQSVGLRQTEAERDVAIAKQKADQLVRDEQKVTAAKDVEIRKVQQVGDAEIDKQVAVVAVEKMKQTTIIAAEGNLQSKKLEAEGIEATGVAEASAKAAILKAPVEAQIALAKEIGQNKEYQEYLITIEKVKATKDIGIESAKALSAADIKVISNTGKPTDGLTNVMDLFSSKGGTEIASMLEALNQTETGSKLLAKVIPTGKDANLNGKGAH